MKAKPRDPHTPPQPVQMAPNSRVADKNIWVAASDGDLQRVQYLIEQEGVSPNIPDPHTYTPMHAAASYGHINVLEYLISRGGDVNVTDEDGDTPLYTVETVEVARWLVEHGAIVDCVNEEGISPAQHLEEEFPAVSHFLGGTEADDTQLPSQYAQDQVADRLTDQMMQSVREVIERAAAEGRDPDEELAELVTRTVLDSLDAGEDLVEKENVDTLDDSSKPSKMQKTSE